MANRNRQRFISLTQDNKHPEEVFVGIDHIKYIRGNTDPRVADRFHDGRAVLEFADGTRLTVEEGLNDVIKEVEDLEKNADGSDK